MKCRCGGQMVQDELDGVTVVWVCRDCGRTEEVLPARNGQSFGTGMESESLVFYSKVTLSVIRYLHMWILKLHTVKDVSLLLVHFLTQKVNNCGWFLILAEKRVCES